MKTVRSLFTFFVLFSFTQIIIAQEKKTPPQKDSVIIKEDIAAKKYVRECSSCHTIGGGKLKGPDLIQAISWKKDDLAKAIKKMEKEVGALSDAVISDLIVLLQDANLKQRLASEEQRQLQARRASLAPPNMTIGKNLFWGTQKFTNGGMQCGACHIVNGIGGSLGLDLTQSYTKMGEVALISACEKTLYKVMEPHYRNKPITPQEAVHLTAYFKQVSQSQPQSEISFHAFSFLAAIGILFGIVFMYKSAGFKNKSRKK